jgi:hypothetical protein
MGSPGDNLLRVLGQTTRRQGRFFRQSENRSALLADLPINSFSSPLNKTEVSFLSNPVGRWFRNKPTGHAPNNQSLNRLFLVSVLLTLMDAVIEIKPVSPRSAG